MKKTTLKKLVLASICSFLTFTISIGQDLIYKVSLEEQVRESSLVIEGEVISQQSSWDASHNNIYTISTVEVYKIFKGQPISTVNIITPGGTVGLEAEIVTPSLQLSIGDLGVFMLHNNTVGFANINSSSFKPYSSIQGFYKYNLLENSAVNPLSVKHNITSFYDEISGFTHSNYIDVKPFNVTDNLINQTGHRGVVLPSISTISPTTANAGTKTLLTISGSFFGATQGTVSFRDSNNGGSSYYTALDTEIVSWIDSEIQVEIPSRAGTGDVLITTSADSGSNSVTSSQTLTIEFAEINVNYDLGDGSGTKAYQTSHVDDDSIGGYTWQMFTDFDANTAAKESFLRAFDTWRCETGVNWTIGDVTTTDAASSDGVNVIRFDNGSELASGVLGVCTSRFSGCLNGSSLEWFVNELDIVFDDTTNWQFGPSNAVSPQIDFETVAVHELGHGHQLAHVINTSAIMHYALGPGDNNRVLSALDISGGNDVQTRSTTLTPCGSTSMTNFDCSTLSIDDTFLSNGIKAFPNPVNSILYLSNSSYINIETVSVFDISGRFIFDKIISSNTSLISFKTDNLSNGLYFVKIETANDSTTLKFIKE